MRIKQLITVCGFVMAGNACASLETPFGGGGLGMGGGDTAFDLGPEGEEPTEIPQTSYIADPFGENTAVSDDQPGTSVFNFPGGYGTDDGYVSDSPAEDLVYSGTTGGQYHNFYEHPVKEEEFVDHHPVDWYAAHGRKKKKNKQDAQQDEQEKKEEQ